MIEAISFECHATTTTTAARFFVVYSAEYNWSNTYLPAEEIKEIIARQSAVLVWCAGTSKTRIPLKRAPSSAARARPGTVRWQLLDAPLSLETLAREKDVPRGAIRGRIVQGVGTGMYVELELDGEDQHGKRTVTEIVTVSDDAQAYVLPPAGME